MLIHAWMYILISSNILVFHGGTNFGFMAGANAKNEAPYYDADVTSYGKWDFLNLLIV